MSASSEVRIPLLSAEANAINGAESSYGTLQSSDVEKGLLGQKKGRLSNSRLVSFLEEDLSSNIPQERIDKIYNKILEFSPWYSPEHRRCCSHPKGFCCEILSWRYLTLGAGNMLALGSGLVYATVTHWESFTGWADFGMVVANLAGGLIVAPLVLPWIEAELAAKITEWHLTHKREVHVLKIQAFIKHLKFFNDKDFDVAVSGSLIAELDVLESVKQKIIRSLNAAQLIRLQDAVGSTKFKNVFDKAFTESQKYILNVLPELSTMPFNTIIGLLKILKRYIKEDPSLFDIVVNAIHKAHGRVEVLDDELVRIGNELKILDASVYVGELGNEVSVALETVEGTIDIKVASKYFLKHESLKNKIVGNKLTIYLECLDDSELNAHLTFFKFINGLKIEIDNCIVVPLFALASRYKIEDCMKLCYEHLANHEEEFEAVFFSKVLLKYAKFSGGKELAVPLVRKNFTEKLREKNYVEVDQFLEVASKYELSLDNELQLYFNGKINRKTESIAILEDCTNLEYIFPYVEQMFSESVNLKIFKSLLKYAEENNSQILTNACREYFLNVYDEKKPVLEGQAEIFNLFPLGQLPKMILDEMQKHTKIKLA